MKIKKHCWSRVEEVYSLDIDQDYVDRFNKYARSHILPKCNYIDLTYDEFCNIVMYEDAARAEETVEYQGNLNYGPFTTYLADMVYDYVNEDLWDSRAEIIDTDTINWEDEYEM